jgi:uncharacterized iron-regulated membrane protein
VTAGAVILFMSVTGVILDFEPQITDWLERDRRIIIPPPDARPLSAEAIRREPFAGQNMDRRLRAWVRPLHTGDLGQSIAFLASAGGAVLVWTGLSVAWRRFRRWCRRPGSGEATLIPEGRQEVSAD